MKNIIKIQSILLLAFFITLPFFLFTQEEETKEKQVTIKTVKEVDGKKIVKDTTFTVSEDDEVKKIVKMYTMDSEGDSATKIMVDVTIDSDEDGEWHSSNKKVIIMKHGDDDEEVIFVPHGSGSKVIKFKSGDGDEENVIIIKSQGHGGHKVITWKSEDGEEYEFDYDYDFDMEKFNDEMAEFNDEMREMQIEIIEEKGRIHSELIELKHIEELERLKELEVIVVPPAPHEPHFYHDYAMKHKGGMEVSDEELREAGIKNKPDRLELNEIDVEKEDGVIDLSFSLAGEGNPKVDVYNIYGDKVFSGKPELMNSKYQIKMDLSKKQYGTYYMQIIVGSSSKTLRLKL